MYYLVGPVEFEPARAACQSVSFNVTKTMLARAIIFDSKSIHVKNIYNNLKNTLNIYARVGGQGRKIRCRIVRVVEARSKKAPRSAPNAGGLSKHRI